MMSRRFVLPFAAALAACAPPPEAPEDLDELSRYLYRTWDDEDVRVPIAGLKNIEAFLEDIELTSATPYAERAWSVDPLQAEDVETLPKRPDRPLKALFGVSLGYASDVPLACHKAWQTQSDQLPAEPTAVTYVRSFPETNDPTCFPDEDCTLLQTVNDARRENAAISASFLLYKDFRSFSWEDDDGEEREAFYSRSWFQDSWPGDDGASHLWQSFTADVWIGRPDGTTWRYQALFNESEVYVLGIRANDEVQANLVSSASEGAMIAQDGAAGGLEACEGLLDQ